MAVLFRAAIVRFFHLMGRRRKLKYPDFILRLLNIVWVRNESFVEQTKKCIREGRDSKQKESQSLSVL